MPQDLPIIAIDWGTSSFRGYLVTSGGTVAERVATADGILSVPPGGFPAVLARTVGAWAERHPGAPTIISGMAGSRQGWCEAPYVPCPAGLDEIAAATVGVEAPPPFGPVRLVPGVMRDGGAAADGGVPDVMRGEETQLMGAATEEYGGNGLFVLPGTHSKWAVLRGGKVAWFATFMTGEMFAVLSQHSILGRLMTAEESGDDADAADAGATAAFDRGVGAGLAAPGPEHGGLLRRLFGARTLPLFDYLPASGVRPYLSGLLIGTEIAEARQCLHLRDRALLTSPVTIIGDARLAARYERALADAGIAARRGPEDAAVRGLVRLAAAVERIGCP